jgi:hypothetical protein
MIMRPIDSATPKAVRYRKTERTVCSWSSILLLCRTMLMPCIS